MPLARRFMHRSPENELARLAPPRPSTPLATQATPAAATTVVRRVLLHAFERTLGRVKCALVDDFWQVPEPLYRDYFGGPSPPACHRLNPGLSR